MPDHLRTAAWLALLVLGITLSAIQLNGDTPHPGQRAHAGHDHDHGDHHKPQRLFSWEPEEAQSLTLRTADGRQEKFLRHGDEWRGPAPSGKDASLDPSTYLGLLSQARKDREFALGTETLESFGLAPALVTIRVENGAGNVLADLSVGVRTPDGFGRYVRMATETSVLIVPNYQFEAVIKALNLDI